MSVGIFIAPTTGSGPVNTSPIIYGTGAYSGVEGTDSGQSINNGADALWTITYTRADGRGEPDQSRCDRGSLKMLSDPRSAGAKSAT